MTGYDYRSEVMNMFFQSQLIFAQLIFAFVSRNQNISLIPGSLQKSVQQFNNYSL